MACLQVAAAFSPTPITRIQSSQVIVSCRLPTSTINKFTNPPININRQGQLRAKTDAEREEEERKKKVREEIFWAKQRAMAAEMNAKSDATLKK